MSRELTPRDSHIIIFNWYTDVDPETFRFTIFPAFDFRERFEILRSGSNEVSDASKIDLGTSFPWMKTTCMSWLL